MSESKRQFPSKRMARISARTGKPMEIIGHTKKSENAATERTTGFYQHLHSRQASRKTVHIEASLNVYLLDGTVHDRGTAVITNMSPSGALLSEIKLPKKTYPVEAFKLEVIMRGGEYEGIGMEAVPVRFEHKCRGLGVKIVELFAAM